MLLDGKLVKNKLLENLENEFKNIKTTLVVIQVGDDFASSKYISQKEKMANKLGVQFKLEKFDKATTEEVNSVISKYNEDKSVSGIIVQLPLPDNIDYESIRNNISFVKDIDGVNDINRIKLVDGKSDALIPCTALGIMKIFDFYNIDLAGSDVVIIGRSIHIGKALYNLLINRDATVTMCHSKTRNLKKYTKHADIIITGVGKANFITQDMVRNNVCLVDVGFNYYNDQICGDVSKEIFKYKYLTPVPGGVGQMTVYSIFENLYKAYNLQNKYVY